MKVDDILAAPRKHPLGSALVIPALAIFFFFMISRRIDITAMVIGYISGFIITYLYYRYLLPLFYKKININE